MSLARIIRIEPEQIEATGALSVAPWETARFGVVSLYDMTRFYGDLFVQTLSHIIQWEVKCSRMADPSTVMNPSILVELNAHVGVMGPDFVVYGLDGAALKAGRIRDRLANSMLPVTYGEMTSMLRELRERIEDDLHSHVFIGLSMDESKLYQNPEDKWREVISRFPKVRHDVEESSKCFALQRYSAAIFHVLLVAEYGIIRVAELFNVAGDKPGWGALDRLQRINNRNWKEKSPLEQEHASFLESLLPLAFAIKDSWRHKINHIDNKLEWMDTDFSPEVAAEIISAARGFMRRLAADLPRPPVKPIEVRSPYAN